MPFVLFPADLSLWDIIQNLRPVPLAVIVILVLFSLFSWTIVFSKSSVFGRARRANKSFLRAFRKANNLQAVAVASEQFGSAPLVAVFDFGYGEIERQMKQRGSLVNKAAVERSLQLGISEEVTKLEMNMTWLATVASVSPFIGLFGTVWGIIDAFEAWETPAAPAYARWLPAYPKRWLPPPSVWRPLSRRLFSTTFSAAALKKWALAWKISPSSFKTSPSGTSGADLWPFPSVMAMAAGGTDAASALRLRCPKSTSSR